MTETDPIRPKTAPRLRKRRVFTLGRVGALLIPAVRAVERTTDAFADWWDEHNDAALAAEGPLWVVLGDSASQGIGADHPSEGYVPRVLDRLRNSTDQPWRTLNLSMTGAKMDDVTSVQIPALAALELTPQLVSCLAGANDLLVPRPVSVVRSTARRLVGALPNGAVVGRVGSGLFASRPRAVNQELNDAAHARGFELFDPWDWPTPKGALARDRFHPNGLGYSFVANQVWNAMRRRLASAG